VLSHVQPTSTPPKGFGNRIVAGLLRSRFHALLSPTVALISFTGPVSGKQHTTPVQYVHTETGWVILVADCHEKVWWKTFESGVNVGVELFVRRQAWVGTGRVVDPAREPELFRQLRALYLARFPRANLVLDQPVGTYRLLYCTGR